MTKYIALIFLLVVNVASAAGTNPFFGKYVYGNYKTVFLNGRTMSLEQLGAQSATIEFRPDMTIQMEMRMLDGTTVVSTAKILEVNNHGTSGSIVEKWPEMSYPVKLDYKFQAKGLSYVIQFNNHGDPMRYGAREEATLFRVHKH
jgi:hypothetical protein